MCNGSGEEGACICISDCQQTIASEFSESPVVISIKRPAQLNFAGDHATSRPLYGELESFTALPESRILQNPAIGLGKPSHAVHSHDFVHPPRTNIMLHHIHVLVALANCHSLDLTR